MLRMVFTCPSSARMLCPILRSHILPEHTDWKNSRRKGAYRMAQLHLHLHFLPIPRC